MPLGLTAAQWGLFQKLEAHEQAQLIAGMAWQDALRFDADFEAWAHENQLPPNGEGWRVWLMMAGRGFGKTRAGAEWVHRLAMMGGRRIALVAASIEEARKVMVEGVSGLLAIGRYHRVKLKWEPSLNQLTWPKGSVATLYSGENPDGLRGPEHHFAWCPAEGRCSAVFRGGRSSRGAAGGKPGGRAMFRRGGRRHRGMGRE